MLTARIKSSLWSGVVAVLPPVLRAPVRKLVRALRAWRSRLSGNYSLDAGTRQALNHLEWLLSQSGQPWRLKIRLPSAAADPVLMGKLSLINAQLEKYGTRLVIDSAASGGAPQPFEVVISPPPLASGKWEVSCTEALVNVLRQVLLYTLTSPEAPPVPVTLLADFEWGDQEIRVPRLSRGEPVFRAFNEAWLQAGARIEARLPKPAGEAQLLSFSQSLFAGRDLKPAVPSDPVYTAIQEALTVKIVIPFRDHLDLLDPLMKTLEAAASSALTPRLKMLVVLVDNGSRDAAEVIRRAKDWKQKFQSSFELSLVREDIVFNHSRLSNAGAAVGPQTEYLLFLNNDCYFQTDGWLSRLLVRIHGEDSLLGASGALHYPASSDGQGLGDIQTMGLELWAEGATKNAFTHGAVPLAYAPFANYAFPCAGITGGALLIKSRVFESIGGFDDLRLPTSFNDVDLCVRAMASTHGVFLVDPLVKAIHSEGRSRGHGSDYFDVTQLYKNRGLVFSDTLSFDPYLPMDSYR